MSRYEQIWDEIVQMKWNENSIYKLSKITAVEMIEFGVRDVLWVLAVVSVHVVLVEVEIELHFALLRVQLRVVNVPALVLVNHALVHGHIIINTYVHALLFIVDGVVDECGVFFLKPLGHCHCWVPFAFL